jgi:hypothetical protein
LLFKASSSKKAADPFLECSRFVVCSCFLPKVFETGLKLEGGTTKLVFCEAGGVIVGSGVPRGVSNPHPEIPKTLQNRAELNPIVKTVQIAEFRTPTPQDVRKKGSKILKLPRFAIVLH